MAAPGLVEIPDDLDPGVIPIAWLLGTWEGAGVAGYPALGPDRRFGQRVVVGHDGRDFLHWDSRTWALDEEGAVGEPLTAETGYWRVVGLTGAAAPVDGRAPTPVPPGADVEFLLVHPTGILEMYAGTASGGRIDLATDVVMRSPAAHEYTAARRLYGSVEGDLLWAMDMAAHGHDLAPAASARLRRVAGAGRADAPPAAVAGEGAA